MHTRAHTVTHAHTSIMTIQNLYTTENGQRGSIQKLDTDEDSTTERKGWQVCSFGKRNVLGFDRKESREAF